MTSIEVGRFVLVTSWQCPLGLRFRASRKGVTGEVGGRIQRVQTAWLLLGLAVERPWLELGRPFLLLWMNQVRKQSSGFVGPAFLTMTLLSLRGLSLAENRE